MRGGKVKYLPRRLPKNDAGGEEIRNPLANTRGTLWPGSTRIPISIRISHGQSTCACAGRSTFTTTNSPGTATLVFETPSSGTVDLDSKGLTITAVQTPTGHHIPYALGDDEPILGRKLQLQLPAQSSEVTIAYRTSSEALALQWLDPAQTAGPGHPFLFSQCQAFHPRPLAPPPDYPRARAASGPSGT